jgi:AcrR family transcriptional regulator
MNNKRELSVAQYITNSLFELMKVKPYNDISITEITDKAKVNRVSFYRNFTSKEDIIDKWIKFTTQNFLSKSDISYQKDSTLDYFTKLFTHLEKYKTEAMLIYNANLFNLLKNEFDNNLINLHKKEYSNYKSYFLAGGIFNVYYFWLINGCKETPHQVAEKLVDLMSK